jgi:hypothetical protein
VDLQLLLSRDRYNDHKYCRITMQTSCVSFVIILLLGIAMFDCNVDGVKCNPKGEFLHSRVTCKANGKLRRSREALLREYVCYCDISNKGTTMILCRAAQKSKLSKIRLRNFVALIV